MQRRDNNEHTGAPPGDFPRLLMLTAFAPNPVSGGALLDQLLKGFPPKQLSWWTCGNKLEGLSATESNQIDYYSIPPRLLPHVRLTRFKCWLLENFWVPRAAAHLQSVVDRVQPEQIWAQLTGWLIPVLARTNLLVSRRCHLSLWDYHNTQSYCRQLGSRRAHHFAHLTESLMRQSTTCDVISQPMWEDIAQRTGRRDAIVLHSGFEPAQVEALLQTTTEPTPEIQIAYAGSIIVPEVFQFFLRALEKLRPAVPRPVVLNFFGRSYRHEPWFNSAWMRDHGLLPEPEFYEALRRCTWGFAPMDLTDNDPNYNRYSFPNKFGTYLSAGLPLIVLAHRESSAAKMMRAYTLGIYTDTQELEVLVPLLRAAFEDPDPRQRFRSEILRCAQTEFNAARMRRNLWDLLRIP